MSKDQVIKSLLFKSQKDVESAKDLFKSGHYDWSLFIWHLAIEKVLKAKIISQNKEIIYTHNLVRLVKLTDLALSRQIEDELTEVTTYNIEARYDDFKLSFYKKATDKYTRKWVKICEKIYKRIKKSI